jgi:hypothetical protein
MEFIRPDRLGDIAKPGLTLAEGKQLLAQVQQEVVSAPVDNHAMLRADCHSCGGTCHVRDGRPHRIATLFGEVRVRLPRFLCAGCGCTETGVSWPPRCRSIPELDQLGSIRICWVETSTSQKLLATKLGTVRSELRTPQGSLCSLDTWNRPKRIQTSRWMYYARHGTVLWSPRASVQDPPQCPSALRPGVACRPGSHQAGRPGGWPVAAPPKIISPGGRS